MGSRATAARSQLLLSTLANYCIATNGSFEEARQVRPNGSKGPIFPIAEHLIQKITNDGFEPYYATRPLSLTKQLKEYALKITAHCGHWKP